MSLNKLRQRRFYGWTALVGAMLVYFSMCGDTIYSYGVFLPAMSKEFHWARSAVSGPYTAYALAGGLFGPLVGISVGRFGARKNIVAGNLVTVLGLLGMSLTSEIWHVYLFFGLLVGTGIAFGAYIPTTTTATRWFVRRRSLTIGLLLVAGGLGGFTFPPLISWLISSIGWRWAWVCLAGVHMLLAVVLAGILIRNKPEEMGQLPDGEAGDADEERGAREAARRRAYQTPVEWSVRDALHTRALWLALIFMAATSFTFNILTTHQVAYLEDLGFPSLMAASALGLLVGMSIIGRLLCGALGTRFESRYLAAVFLTGLAFGVIVLMNIKGLPSIYLYALLSGISYGGIFVLEPALLGAYFGRANYAQIVGWTVPITGLIGATSPLLAGFIYDVARSYIPVFGLAAGLLGVGLICALLARPPKPREVI